MKCVQAFCLYHFFIPVAHKSFPFLKLNLACHDLVMGLSKEAESPGYWHRGQLGLALQGIFSAVTGTGLGSSMEALYPLLKLHRNTPPWQLLFWWPSCCPVVNWEDRRTGEMGGKRPGRSHGPGCSSIGSLTTNCVPSRIRRGVGVPGCILKALKN